MHNSQGGNVVGNPLHVDSSFEVVLGHVLYRLNTIDRIDAHLPLMLFILLKLIKKAEVPLIGLRAASNIFIVFPLHVAANWELSCWRPNVPKVCIFTNNVIENLTFIDIVKEGALVPLGHIFKSMQPIGLLHVLRLTL